jgi:hypothetical protein
MEAKVCRGDFRRKPKTIRSPGTATSERGDNLSQENSRRPSLKLGVVEHLTKRALAMTNLGSEAASVLPK